MSFVHIIHGAYMLYGAWRFRGEAERERREQEGQTDRDRQRQTERLESKRPRVNGDVRNSRLTQGSHVTSEVWEKRHSEGHVASAYVLCCVYAQIFFVALVHYT